MVKSVERTKKKTKPVVKAETIKNEKGGNQNVNQITIKITQPKEKKKKEKKTNEPSRKQIAIEKLRDDLAKFSQLKREAEALAIKLPKKLGESPDNINQVNSVPEIQRLENEIETRNRIIEQLIENDKIGKQTSFPSSGMPTPGIFPQQPAQPPAQQPAQPPQQQPAQPPQQQDIPEANITDFNRLLQSISNEMDDVKMKLSTLIDENTLGGLAKFGIGDKNKVTESLSTAENLDTELETITKQLDTIKNDSNILPRDRETIRALENDEEFSIGSISVKGIKELSTDLIDYINKLNEWLKDTSQDPIAGDPIKPVDTTGETLKQIRDEIIAELRKENKPIPDDIDKQAQEEFEEQQEKQSSEIPTDIQDEINNLKKHSSTDYANKVEQSVEETIRFPNKQNLDMLEKLTHDDLPTEVDEYLVHSIYDKVEKITKSQQEPQQEPQPVTQPIDKPKKKKKLKIVPTDTYILNEIAQGGAAGLPEVLIEDNELEVLSNTEEPQLNNRVVAEGWINNWTNYKQLTKDIKNNIQEFEGGIFDIPEDKANDFKSRITNLSNDYTNYKQSLTPLQKGTIDIPPIKQYDEAITQGLNTSLDDIVKLILKQEGKPVSQVVVGSVEETPLIKSTRERFVADGDFDKLLNTLAKQYRGTIKIDELNVVNDKIEQSKSTAQRTYRTLGSGEISVQTQYKNYIDQLNDLQNKVNEKIQNVDNPPKFKYQMMEGLQIGEKIPVDKGFVERDMKGDIEYQGGDMNNYIQEVMKRNKEKETG